MRFLWGDHPIRVEQAANSQPAIPHAKGDINVFTYITIHLIKYLTILFLIAIAIFLIYKLLKLLLSRSKIKGHIDLYYFIAKNIIGIKDIREIMNPYDSRLSWIKNFRLPFTKPRIDPHTESKEELVITTKEDDEKKYISDFNTLEYSVSDCCNPLPGDNVMGLIFPNEPIQIHLTNCEVAIRLMSQHGKNIVKAKWKQKAGITFLAGINIKAADSIGLISEITKPITEEFNINIRSFNLKSSEGLAEMDISIYVISTQVLKKLMTRLKKIKSIIKVTRLDKI